jgi:predicted CopG family antitoxin
LSALGILWNIWYASRSEVVVLTSGKTSRVCAQLTDKIFSDRKDCDVIFTDHMRHIKTCIYVSYELHLGSVSNVTMTYLKKKKNNLPVKTLSGRKYFQITIQKYAKKKKKKIGLTFRFVGKRWGWRG